MSTLGTAIDYQIETGQLKPSTLEGYQLVASKLKEFGMSDTKLEELNGAQVKKFLNSLEVGDTTKYSIYLSRIRNSVNTYCEDHNVSLKVNFKNIMKMPKPVEKEDEDYLSLDEVNYLFALTFEKDKDDKIIPVRRQVRMAYARDMLLVLCWSGMAIGDLEKFDPKKIISEDYKWLTYYRKKNSNKCRVMVTPQLKELIERNSWPLKLGRRMLDNYFKEFGNSLGRVIRTHDGRKTFATLMLTLGMSIEMVSSMLGHRTTATTAKFYARISQEKAEDETLHALEKLIQLNNKKSC